MQLRLKLDQLLLGFADFLDCHLAHVGVAVFQQSLRALKIALHPSQLLVKRNDRLHFGVLPGIGAKACLIADDFGIAKQCGQFLETVAENIQLIEQ
ncbi:Predicted double-glycine peptidase [Pseudomonas syringae pv. actinidiae]|uniref:Predicted double-glycine peptidase n=1 Tax=Pseudomonas syringae pv. actinidiae TaxID=103796 RepID=A0AAN4Q214_PSESF|nr:Predicted double-glycine peptidase [Pseudomonas syringae pv. actinidiae]